MFNNEGTPSGKGTMGMGGGGGVGVAYHFLVVLLLCPFICALFFYIRI